MKGRLVEEIARIPVIDTHEHLSPESDRLREPVDVFTLFSHYTMGDLLVSGMKEEDCRSLYDRSIPLITRWRKLAPFWERIRNTCYSRALLLAVKKFYGFDDINEANCEELSERITANNTPGLYERVLRDACNIKTCLTQCSRTDTGSDLLTPVMPMLGRVERIGDLRCPWFEPETTVNSLDEYVEALNRYIRRVKSEGAVGLKMASIQFGEPDEKGAASAFAGVLKGELSYSPDGFPNRSNPIRDYLTDFAIRTAAELDMVMAVHSGYWNDFRDLHPLNMIPLLQKYPGVRFDLYHLGYPWVRESLMLGKGFPNVWINFCWLHIISQKCAFEALDEAFELLPVNKVLGFGGDYLVVEKVFGHLTMARENIAKVLAGRMVKGEMDEEQALSIARMWLYENPKELYRLAI